MPASQKILRVGFSKLKFHKFKHNFRDTINPMCVTNDDSDDMEHSRCPVHLLTFNDLLLAKVLAAVQPFGQNNPSNEASTEL